MSGEGLVDPKRAHHPLAMEFCANRNQLAFTRPDDRTLYLAEPGRAGVFRWRRGDCTEAVEADPLQGVYVASRHCAPAAGAWVRDHVPGEVWAPWWGAWFGYDPAFDHPPDATDALQAAVDFAAAASAWDGYARGGVVRMPKGYASWSRPLWLKDGVRLVGPGISAGGLVWRGGNETEHPLYIGNKDQSAAFDCGVFDMTVKSRQDPLTTLPGLCLVYTSSAQHTGGIARVKIEGGARTQFRAEVGWGGASYLTFADVETHSLAGIDGAPDNPQIELDYASAFVEARNIVVQGGESRANGTPLPPVPRGLLVKSGYVNVSGFHAEHVADAIVDAIRANTPHHLELRNAIGGAGVTNLVRTVGDAAVGHLLIGRARKNGAANLHRDDRPGGFTFSTDIFADRVF